MVFGLSQGGLASRMVLEGDACPFAPVPPSMDPRDAAALPTVCLTANMALNSLALIGRGEAVLLHTATGGVGLAALQVANACDANAVGTAGTAEKRSFLRAQGVRTVCHSRSVAFAADIVLAGGAFPACTLNTLTGHGMATMCKSVWVIQ